MEMALCLGPGSPGGGAGEPRWLDPTEAAAAEVALCLAEAAGGQVAVVVAGVAGPVAVLGEVLAMGAAAAVAVTGPGGEVPAVAAGPWVARALAGAVGRRGSALVVIADRGPGDGAGLLAGQLAELLGWPAVTGAHRVEVDRGEAGRPMLEAERPTAGGAVARVTCPWPAVVSVAAGATRPRLPTYAGLRAARAVTVEVLAGPVLPPGAPPPAAPLVVPPVGAPVAVDDGDGRAHLHIVEALERAGAW